MSQNNMVFGLDRWNAVVSSGNFNEVCAGYGTPEKFWGLQEEIIHLEKGMRFLDVGCGPGRAAEGIKNIVGEYHGVDAHEDLISMAREHFRCVPNIYFYVNNSRDLSMFEDNTFDYVYERLMFIHIVKEWIETYIMEMYRVLKPGGILYIPDLPEIDHLVNGFTRHEVDEMFKDFSLVEVQKFNTWTIYCKK